MKCWNFGVFRVLFGRDALPFVEIEFKCEPGRKDGNGQLANANVRSSLTLSCTGLAFGEPVMSTLGLTEEPSREL
jgi:hypothetical protein